MSTFVIGSPGTTPSEAFNLAIAVTKKECDHGVYIGTIAEKYSYYLLSAEPFESYEEALKKANVMLEKGNLNPEDKHWYAMCQRFKNVSGGIDYLFFGWMNEE